jgi:hypothetical protein
MALPTNGPISLGDVRSELGLSGRISLGDSAVRSLAERETGSISLSHLYGKSSGITLWSGSVTFLAASNGSYIANFGYGSLNFGIITPGMPFEYANITFRPALGGTGENLTFQVVDSRPGVGRINKNYILQCAGVSASLIRKEVTSNSSFIFTDWHMKIATTLHADTRFDAKVVELV